MIVFRKKYTSPRGGNSEDVTVLHNTPSRFTSPRGNIGAMKRQKCAAFQQLLGSISQRGSRCCPLRSTVAPSFSLRRGRAVLACIFLSTTAPPLPQLDPAVDAAPSGCLDLFNLACPLPQLDLANNAASSRCSRPVQSDSSVDSAWPI